jgi:hypothetical protein
MHERAVVPLRRTRLQRPGVQPWDRVQVHRKDQRAFRVPDAGCYQRLRRASEGTGHCAGPFFKAQADIKRSGRDKDGVPRRDGIYIAGSSSVTVPINERTTDELPPRSKQHDGIQRIQHILQIRHSSIDHGLREPLQNRKR